MSNAKSSESGRKRRTNEDVDAESSKPAEKRRKQATATPATAEKGESAGRPRKTKLSRILDDVAAGDKEMIVAEKLKVPHERRKTSAALAIRRVQQSRAPVLPAAAIKRVVRDTICTDRCRMRIENTALLLIQEGVETHEIRRLRSAANLAKHARRVTVTLPDVEIVAQVASK